MREVDVYLSGDVIYGDDFDADDIKAWFLDEVEGYAGLCEKSVESYSYSYHALNRRLGFRHLPDCRFSNVLGFGSACGDELLPIIERVDRVTIVDASDTLVRQELCGKPARYIKALASGDLPLPTETFDLITCLGVLHHIPNVSHVISELSRVLTPGGHMLLREPIVSMGDWRRPRSGLTRRERGIPLRLLLDTVKEDGLEVLASSLCAFPITPRLFRGWRNDPYNSTAAVTIDALLSRLFAWNVNYHPTHPIQRLRPTSVYLVLRKAR